VRGSPYVITKAYHFRVRADYRKSADYKRYSARITRPGIEFFAGTMRLKGATVWEVDLLPVD